MVKRKKKKEKTTKKRKELKKINKPKKKKEPSIKKTILKTKPTEKEKPILEKQESIPEKKKPTPEKQESILKKEPLPTKPTKKGIEKISSGIENFDELTKGGFKKNSINLLVGGSGSGKSIFAVQFLIEGIKKGEKCLYLNFQEKKQEFYSNMYEFGWDLEKFEKQEKFFFIEYTPEKVRTMLEEGGGAIENIILEKKVTRIVIDSITSFELLFEKEFKKREAALSLFNMLRKWDCTSLMTYEGDPTKPGASPPTLEFETDSTTFIYFLRIGKKRQRYIEIKKMRGTEHAKEIYPLSIENNKITISKKPAGGELGI